MDAVDRAERERPDGLSVADDFGKSGRAWVEADYDATDLETVIQDLLTGQYTNPIRVIAFDIAERWSEDVSADVARELRRRCDLQMRDVPFFLRPSPTAMKAGTGTYGYRAVRLA